MNKTKSYVAYILTTLLFSGTFAFAENSVLCGKIIKTVTQTAGSYSGITGESYMFIDQEVNDKDLTIVKKLSFSDQLLLDNTTLDIITNGLNTQNFCVTFEAQNNGWSGIFKEVVTHIAVPE